MSIEERLERIERLLVLLVDRDDGPDENYGEAERECWDIVRSIRKTWEEAGVKEYPSPYLSRR